MAIYMMQWREANLYNFYNGYTGDENRDLPVSINAGR